MQILYYKDSTISVLCTVSWMDIASLSLAHSLYAISVPRVPASSQYTPDTPFTPDAPLMPPNCPIHPVGAPNAPYTPSGP